MSKKQTFFIFRGAKNVPKLPFEMLKEEVLGVGYMLSLMFLSSAKARSLNYAYRKKTYTPNVLSFPLDKESGEIVLCLPIAKREAKERRMTYRDYVGYLFIHGLLHLKGLRHGARMDAREKELMKKFRLGVLSN